MTFLLPEITAKIIYEHDDFCLILMKNTPSGAKKFVFIQTLTESEFLLLWASKILIEQQYFVHSL
jgi:hypothetical protein